jgi:hypothetical protein
LKLTDNFLAASVSIQHLAEKGSEGVFFGKKPSPTHRPCLFRLEQLAGNKLVKNLSDLFERFLLEQSHFFGKFLLGGTGFSTSAIQVKSWKHWHGIFYISH